VKYYLAYGMNTNLQSMRDRCPAARSLGLAVLANHRLVFKYHADMEPANDVNSECVLWHITDACEQSLDALEGFPHYYQKKSVEVYHQAQRIECMIYYMVTGSPPGAPPDSYYNMVLQGYQQHGLDTGLLENARQLAYQAQSHDNTTN
jgi:hypothetical protein